MIDIAPIQHKRHIRSFIKTPWKVYANDPYWVPPLLTEVKFCLSEKNPFWDHAERALFLARKEGCVVGRIAAIIDKNYIKLYQRRTGFFGFFESLPDYQISKLLLDAAVKWLREKGMTEMQGPFNPSINEECGMLVEGFDSSPYIMMTYNPPYYPSLMKQYGMQKAKDLLAFTMDLTPAIISRLERVAERVKYHNPKIKLHKIRLKELRSELNSIKDIYNSAWSENWGFVPMTDDEINSMAKRLKPIIVPEIIQIAEINGDPAGFLMAIPNYNEVLIRLHGRLNIVGLLKFLWYSRKIKTVRLMALGIKKKYRKKGIDALLYLESLKETLSRGYERCEFSWVLEDNDLICRAAKAMGGRLYKRYRIYRIAI
jgi:hypothetical protein